MSRQAKAILYYGFALQARRDPDYEPIVNVHPVDCTEEELWKFWESVYPNHDDPYRECLAISVHDVARALIFATWYRSVECNVDSCVEELITMPYSMNFDEICRLATAIKKHFGIELLPRLQLTVSYS